MKEVYLAEGDVFEDIISLPNSVVREFSTSDAIRSARSKLRYLAAFYPDANIRELAEKIHALLGYPQLPLSDLRIILEGRSLADASKVTFEVPVAAIQKAGKVLRSGGGKLTAAKAAGISVDTVEAIERYCGIAQEFHDRMMDTAVIAVREGWTVRKFAEVTGMSRGRAHRFLLRARQVLVEIGEVA